MGMASKLQRLDEIDHEPVVGRYYLVPCVYGRTDISEYHQDWHPVLLPLHSDPELGEAPAVPHWHLDRRFTPVHLGGESERSNRDSAGQVVRQDEHGPIEWRKRRCVRQMPDWPLEKNFAKRLEALCQEARLKPGCMKCPHRGTDLRNLPQRPDGTVMCPSHGLVWNLTTGELVPRTEARRCL